jgi:hypothetical protein
MERRKRSPGPESSENHQYQCKTLPADRAVVAQRAAWGFEYLFSHEHLFTGHWAHAS